MLLCRCSEDIDECASEPCQHDGVCIDHVNGYECNCTANYTGFICEFDVSKFTAGFFTHSTLCVGTVYAIVILSVDLFCLSIIVVSPVKKAYCVVRFFHQLVS